MEYEATCRHSVQMLQTIPFPCPSHAGHCAHPHAGHGGLHRIPMQVMEDSTASPCWSWRTPPHPGMSSLSGMTRRSRSAPMPRCCSRRRSRVLFHAPCHVPRGGLCTVPASFAAPPVSPLVPPWAPLHVPLKAPSSPLRNPLSLNIIPLRLPCPVHAGVARHLL